MTAFYAVRAMEIAADDTVPGRFTEAGLRELVEALGGEDDPDREVWELLRERFAAHTVEELGQQLLDTVLVQPPIPAYCESLLFAMRDGKAPWADHEVTSDRINLWYAAWVAHHTRPEEFPAPPISRVTLQVASGDATARPPGRRGAARDRTSFVARLLQARPGDNPIAAEHGAPDDGPAEWAFDLLWGAEFSDRGRADADLAEALQVPEGSLCFTVQAWMPPQWVGDLTAGQTWSARAFAG